MTYPVPGGPFQPVQPAYVTASFGRRFGALLLDLIGIGIVGAIVAAVLNVPGAATTTTTANGGTTSGMLTNSGWGAAIIILLSAVYCIPCWTVWGATIGQRFLGLHVFGATGPKPLLVAGAAIRWFVLFGVGSLIGALAVVNADSAGIVGFGQFVWAVVLAVTTYQSPTKQGWHDRLAGSYVVRG
jgi:uncharacterized RDD family membrane protein YckC